MTHDQLAEFYQRKLDKFLNIIDFVSQNRHIKTNVDILINSKALINKTSAKERIRLVFIDALSASGGTNLTRNGTAGKNFYQKTRILQDTPQIDLLSFYKCFNNNIYCFRDVYDYLRSSPEIVNFGKKKSALFLYKLNWLQSYLDNEQKIFTNYNVEISDLIIPVDVVITLVLNRILNIPKSLSLDQYKDFDLINDFFKSELNDKFLLIEDFWFWGYFTTKGSGTNRTFEFNDDKFYSSDLIIPLSANKKYFNSFLDLIRE